MDWLQTVIIAIVEGLTEFLPVSSTGHMIIAQSVLGIESTPFVKAFTVIIQFGAILSVVVLYWRKFFYPETMRTKGYTWWQAIWRFYLKLIAGVLPAVVLGLAFNDFIESNLGNVTLVAVMLILGGIFMLFCDRIFNKGKDDTGKLSERKAVYIGLFQCIAMIPGVSRSMATIVGGMAQGLTRKAAAEFSFFLAVPTMFAATVYSILKFFLDGKGEIIWNNLEVLLLGNVVAFIVALLAIKFFINFLAKYGFKAFGWYRIVVGLVILVLLFTGHELTLS